MFPSTKLNLLSVFFLAVVTASCGKQAPVIGQGPADSAIIGEIDWGESSSSSAPQDVVSAADSVGLLVLQGGRCTAFVVAKDIIMTNAHCISSADDAAGARFIAGVEEGKSREEYQGYDCSTYLASDKTLDVALVKCAKNIGDDLGVLALSKEVAIGGNPEDEEVRNVYIVHQNCDYTEVSDCMINKKISPGIGKLVGNLFAHTGDTLQGSSGAPVLNSKGEVIALHNLGLGADKKTQRGRVNAGVPMSLILEWAASL